MINFKFKTFILISLIILIITPILFVRVVSNVLEQNSTINQNSNLYLNQWVDENVKSINMNDLNNEEWRRKFISEAEEQNVDVLIIYDENEMLYTGGMLEPINSIMLDEKNTDDGKTFEHYYFGLDHFNIYSNDTLIASIYITYPRTVDEQLNQVNYDFFIYIVVFIILSILFLVFLHINLIKPLQEINNSSNMISKGRFNVKLPESRIKEMNYTTRAFSKMANNLAFSKKKNEQLEEERKLFVSSIVHDLRTPIFSLRGFLEGISKGIIRDHAKKEKYLEMSMKQANHLNDLVTSLANYASIEGQIKMEEITFFKLKDLITDLKESLYFNLNEKNIVVNIYNNTERGVYGDYSLIRRAFENIIINSIRHSPYGGTIKVFIEEVEDSIQVVFRDYGNGFSEEDLQYVFRPSYIGKSKESNTKDRMGLGLTIAQVIIQKHRGSISLGVDIETGAKVIVKIPFIVN